MARAEDQPVRGHRAERYELLGGRSPGHRADGPAVRFGVTEDHAGPGAGRRVAYLHAAVVAWPLRERVRGEPAFRVDQDHPHPRVLAGLAGFCEAVRGIAWPGQRCGELVLTWRDVEVEDAVVVRQALVVRELRAGGVAQRGTASLDVLVRADGAAAEVDELSARAGVGDRDRPAVRAARRAGCGQLAAGQEQGVAYGAAAVEGLGKLDGLEAVQQARALLGGGGAEVGGAAQQDLLDLRGRRGRAAMRLPVGLDDE